MGRKRDIRREPPAAQLRLKGARPIVEVRSLRFPDEPVFEEPEAAKYLDKSPDWMRSTRIGRIKNGPAFIRMGRRGWVLYPKSYLDAWKAKRQPAKVRVIQDRPKKSA